MSHADDRAQGRTPEDRSEPAYTINANGANHVTEPTDANPRRPIPAGSLDTISPTQPLIMPEDLIAQGGQEATNIPDSPISITT